MVYRTDRGVEILVARCPDLVRRIDGDEDQTIVWIGIAITGGGNGRSCAAIQFNDDSA